LSATTTDCLFAVSLLCKYVNTNPNEQKNLVALFKYFMLIQHKEADHKGSFYVAEGDEVLAEMVYTMASPTKMIIEHTEVDDKLRGKNVGYQLVQNMVDYARTNNIKVIPLCPFTNSVFKKKKDEYADVLFKM
jgi:predicted GNAT family acetyltransferase